MLNEMIYMVTGKQPGKLPFPETAEVARAVATGGMVLLKNDGTLPITAGKLAVFGVGADDTIVCGTGSGFAFSPYKVSVLDGLKKAGITITSGAWLTSYRKAKNEQKRHGKKLSVIDKRWSGITLLAEEPKITDTELAEAREADIALYMICRNTGEEFDRKGDKGDYYLSDREEENLRRIAAHFPHTVVILNTCVIDASLLEQIPGISAIILMGQAGLEAGNALADILTGKTNPSGKLTDTWAKQYADYPASATFSSNDGNTLQEDYTEDIFVGYRYFDTFQKQVVYPFGYGLSYTTFTYRNIHVQADWEYVTVSVEVENTGSVPGREIVQVYASAPAGSLPKPYQELKGYAKTGTIQPGKIERVTIRFNTESMSSFSEEKSAWIMDAGDYQIRVGSHSRNTTVAAIIRLDALTVVRYCIDCLEPDHPMELLRPENSIAEENNNTNVITLHAVDFTAIAERNSEKVVNTYVPSGTSTQQTERKFSFPVKMQERYVSVRDVSDALLQDVQSGKVTMEEFVASLDMQTLLRLVTGIGCETKHAVPTRNGQNRFTCALATAASGKTTAQYVSSLGIPAAALADGPAGLHLMGTSATAYPVGMVVAQNWDTELTKKLGDCFGMEMERAKVTILLGPGMNIHRDPLCGRNFEYYSEDPLLTGLTAGAFTKGLQENHPGYGVAIKHFAANNQEMDRGISNSTISKRALREVYLKGFEICVRVSQPKTVMTSYNCLNGLHTSSRYDLLTSVLRDEWGFQGMVMTDWDSQSEKPFDLHAGNDIIMGGYPTDVIAAAIEGTKPEFDPDGAVHQNKISMYGGVFKKMVDCWGAFIPERNGPDRVSTKVKAGQKLSPRVIEMVDRQMADIQDHSDGSKTVTYFGTDRGAYLPLGDVQRSAMRVLSMLMTSAAMNNLKKK